MLTPAFRCHTGVKQGCMLSPTLFNLYLSDLSEELKAKNVNDVELNELPLSCMLYADGLVIFSKSKNGLQDYLDSLSEYYKENDLSVNLKVLLRRKFLFLFPSFFNINLLYMFKIIQIAKNWNDTCVRGLEISH